MARGVQSVKAPLDQVNGRGRPLLGGVSVRSVPVRVRVQFTVRVSSACAVRSPLLTVGYRRSIPGTWKATIYFFVSFFFVFLSGRPSACGVTRVGQCWWAPRRCRSPVPALLPHREYTHARRVQARGFTCPLYCQHYTRGVLVASVDSRRSGVRVSAR